MYYTTYITFTANASFETVSEKNRLKRQNFSSSLKITRK